MPAYVVLVREKPIHDLKEMETYSRKARENPRDPKMKPLALYGAMQSLEGDVPDGVVLLEFPSVEDAKNWYYSPSYQAAAQHRMKGADYHAMIVEGL